MIYNLYGFIHFARYVREREKQERWGMLLHGPILLLILFFLGYMAVGLFGKPDLIVAGILFGGSVFVFVIYHLLSRITQRIIENERLAADLRAAEESSRAKSSFLASVSHEMRTPMNVILGLDDMALKRPDLPAETREQLEKIGRNGRHLLGLINNTLDMQHIEAGELAAKLEPFSLREAVEEVAAIAGTLCEEKGLAFAVSAATNSS